MAKLSFKRKVYIVIWKAVLLRKRSPILSICEFLCPLIVVFIAFLMNRTNVAENHPTTEKQFIIPPPKELSSFSLENGTFGYTPLNETTLSLMKNVASGVGKVTTKSFDSEDELESWLKDQKQPFGIEDSGAHFIGVVFLEASLETKTLKYKIRACDESGLTTSTSETSSNTPYMRSFFLGTQLWIDHAFLNNVGIEEKHYLIGELPYVKSIADSLTIYIFYIFLSFSYVFLLLLLSKNVIQEKETGIKEMSKLMGMSSGMIWGHWLVYSLVVQLPVTFYITVILTEFNPRVLAIPPLFVGFLLSLFVVNCIALLFAATCLFSASVRGTTIIVLAWICVHFATVMLVVPDDPDGLGFVVEALLCLLLPSFNIVNLFRIIMMFENYDVKLTLGMLFDKGYSTSLSIGIAILIFLISTCVYVMITFFLDAIHPGPYGVAKPVTFLCVRSKRRDPDETDGRSSLPKTYEPPPQNSKVGIEIRGLKKTYGIFHKTEAVKNVNLDIYEGEIMALLGHNGAGKTTTMSMITGMFSPTGGTIRVNGEDIYSSTSQFRNSLGLCPQQNVYFPNLTVIEHLEFFAMLKGLPKVYSKVQGMRILDTLGIADKKDARVGDLSGGMKRRLCLAISLSGNPKVLILDEPTSGLDPENRRKIWDIILGMRGQRTILITTHFMEEADVLGDRIAIMDKGQVVCCGTTMFLKKLYGAGYQVFLLTKLAVSPTSIAKFVNQNYAGERLKIKSISPTQVAFVLKENNVDAFPSLFSALERSKDELGITGMSVTCSTIEDAFLNVAKMSTFDENIENTPNQHENSPKQQKLSKESTTSTRSIETINRLSGIKLFIHRLSTLLLKRFIYLRRNIISFLVRLVLTCICIGFVARSDFELKSEDSMKPLKTNLDLYPQAVIPISYDQKSKNLGDTAAHYIRKHRAAVELLPNDTQLVDHAVKLAIDNFSKYQATTLFGMSFIELNSTVLYQRAGAYHSPAVAANLISNVVLQFHAGSGTIETTNHPYSTRISTVCVNVIWSEFIINLKWWLVFTVVLITMMMEFITFVVDESSSGFKHQQYLAGVSPCLYWLAMFISDFLLYLLVMLLYLLIIAVFGSHMVAWNSSWMGLLALVLLLNGLSGLFFLYLFSFFFTSITTGSSLFLMFNVAFTEIAAFVMIILLILYTSWKFFLVVALFLLVLNPMFSVSMCIYYIMKSAIIERMCNKCVKCENPVTYEDIVRMPTHESKGVILHYILALALCWIAYLAIILIIDYGFISQLKSFYYKRNASREEEESDDEDEDIKVERATARLYRELEDYTMPLRVEALNKQYSRGPKAVKNVTFVVDYGECFGLLGVNGAGKTTTFKMITGEITPNAGDAMILRDSVVRHRRRYMRQVGYCPQFDALLACLTGRETLWLMARLRGVRPADTTARVDQWLSTLGIEEHADKRNGAYSGGTRRKLSTAAAFIGDPVVVFLDEPTTGIDPAARRKLWNVLQTRKQAGQSIVLTSHSMEECEALCTRITILVAGQMMCIGSCEYLKAKFSQGYNVLLKISGTATSQGRESVKKAFTRLFQSSVLKDEHQTLVSYHVTDPSIPLSQIFAAVLRLKSQKAELEDFSISNTTLEQLFLSFAQQETPDRK